MKKLLPMLRIRWNREMPSGRKTGFNVRNAVVTIGVQIKPTANPCK